MWFRGARRVLPVSGAVRGRIVGSATKRWPRLAVLGFICLGSCWVTVTGRAIAETTSFGFTSGEQTFTVPAWVSTIHVVAVGGRGGTTSPYPGAFPGGFGATATADLPVTAGRVLYVEVAGKRGYWLRLRHKRFQRWRPRRHGRRRRRRGFRCSYNPGHGTGLVSVEANHRRRRWWWRRISWWRECRRVGAG